MRQGNIRQDNMRQSNMRIIGITGGIGSGKSTVMNILKERYGAEIIEADALGRLSMRKGTDTYLRMIEEFGEEILDAKGEIDRDRLSEILLSSEENLKVQNSIVHPFVIDLIKERINICRMSKKSLAAVESAILFEAGCDALCDEVWLVAAERDTRIRRLMSDRGYTYEKAEAFMRRQKTDDFFLERCSKVIYNNGDVKNLSKQIKKCIED